MIVSILVMYGLIGLGVFIGWLLWGIDMEYYKDLAEGYKNKLTSLEVQEAKESEKCSE